MVLAGGRSRRMGRDKASVMLLGRSLLARTCDRLAPQCALLAVSRHDRALVAGSDRPTIPDDLPYQAGPLAGVLAALDWAAAHAPGARHVATVAVDTPFLPTDLVRRLALALNASNRPVACAASGGRLHPVAALWPVSIREALRGFMLSEGIARMMSILDRVGFVAADWPVEHYDPFLNINTPEDLSRAETVAEALDRDAAPGR